MKILAVALAALALLAVASSSSAARKQSLKWELSFVVAGKPTPIASNGQPLPGEQAYFTVRRTSPPQTNLFNLVGLRSQCEVWGGSGQYQWTSSLPNLLDVTYIGTACRAWVVDAQGNRVSDFAAFVG